MRSPRLFAPPVALAGILAAGTAVAAGNQEANEPGASGTAGAAASPETREVVENAARTVETMKSDPELANLLEQSEGVYIVPSLIEGAFVVGASGGDGVLITREGGEWGDPAFYTLGSISVGAQGGGAEGPIAMVLVSEEALQSFKDDENFAIGADAGLTIVGYSAEAQANLGRGDIVLWSDKSGAFVGAAIDATDISFDEEANRAYYGQSVTPQQIVEGEVDSPQDETLQDAFSG